MSRVLQLSNSSLKGQGSERCVMRINLLVLAALIASPGAAQGPGQLLAAEPVNVEGPLFNA